ncbi:hypothetical protein KJ586_00890 [Patescibacteria group bacterium]|nr:hypothetical protein [Patescibacteria group bacterium]MBU4455050.1 hypothetical protein [Patescibacteria group bacterium]
MKKLIVFVCNGNIHRSAVAEACLRQEIEIKGLISLFEVISRGLQGSAGTNPPKHKNLSEYPLEWAIQKPILTDLGLDITKHISMPINHGVVKKASLIIAMDKKVLVKLPNSLIKQFPKHSYKMKLFMEFEGKQEDVPDCFGSSDVGLHRYVNELIVKTIKERFNELLNILREEGKNG